MCTAALQPGLIESKFMECNNGGATRPRDLRLLLRRSIGSTGIILMKYADVEQQQKKLI